MTQTQRPLDMEFVHSQFPGLRDEWVFFDNAGGSQTVKGAVDRIRTFPEDAEKPTVSLLSRRSRVVSVVISGDQDLHQLHALAERTRAELLASEEITQVEVYGLPPLEVSIEIPRFSARSLYHSLLSSGMSIASSRRFM